MMIEMTRMYDKEKIRKRIEIICTYYRDKAEREDLTLEENYEEIWNLISEDLRKLFSHYKAEGVRIGYLLDAKEGVMRIKINYPDCRLIPDLYRISFVNKEAVRLRSVLDTLDRVQQIDVRTDVNNRIRNIIKFLEEEKKTEVIDNFNIDVRYDGNDIMFPRIVVTVMKDDRRESIALGATVEYRVVQ